MLDIKSSAIRKELFDSLLNLKKYNKRGMQTNNSNPDSLCIIDTIAVKGKSIENTFKCICLDFTIKHHYYIKIKINIYLIILS